MPGIRVKHPTLTNGTFLVPIPPKGPKGVAKNVQIHLDDEGCALISQGVWDELMRAAQELDLDVGLLILNEVPNPPEQLIGGNHHPEMRPTYALERDAIRQIAPVGVVSRTVERPINIRS